MEETINIYNDQLSSHGTNIIVPDGRIGTILTTIGDCHIVGFWKEDGLFLSLDAAGAYTTSECKILHNLCDKLKGLEKVELYTPVCGNVVLQNVKDDRIEVVANKYQEINQVYIFDMYGRLHENGDVLLFPSKEQQTWDNWERPSVRKYNHRYWFVSSKLNVCEKVDLGEYQDNHRFQIGNYYSTEEKAQIAKEKVIQAYKSVKY